MKITNKELVSTQECINITVEFEKETYRFQAVIYETPKVKFVTELSYLDWGQKKLKHSDKLRVKEFIKNELLQ